MRRSHLQLVLAVTWLAIFSCAEQAVVSPDGSVSRKKKKKAKKSAPATPMYVVVDSVADPIDSSGGGKGSCSASTQLGAVPSPGDAEGKCTLREGLTTASGLNGMPIVVVLRPGRYRLSAPLPEVIGKVELRAADGPFRRPKKGKKTKGKGAGGANTADAADVEDADFRPGLHQLAPIGTTIDGGNTHQLLRTAYGSAVRVQSVRFENGAAVDEASDDKRSTLGGAINALGKLTLNNSVVRRCRAINGGAFYTEGKVLLQNSLLYENRADRCGGLIYTAGPASISHCEVRSNACGHFDCKKLDDEGTPGQPLPSWRKRAEPSGNFDDDDDDDGSYGGPAAKDDDAAGAVAEGPSLLRVPPPPASSKGRVGGGAKRKKAKGGGKRRTALSSEDADELDKLASEVEGDHQEELRQRELEDREAASEAASEEASEEAAGAPQRVRLEQEARGAEAEAEGECDAEKHGGDGGVVHELTCAPGLWRTGRKMPTECVRWAATKGCDGDGERDEGSDLSCFDFVPTSASGYCECAGGTTAAKSDCKHESVFTCQAACRQLRERRRRSKGKGAKAKAGGKDGGKDGGSTKADAIGQIRQAYAIGAFGTSANNVTIDGLGLICSDGSRTALVGKPPRTAHARWEFVCPGWAEDGVDGGRGLCRDKEAAWDDVAHRPLCAAWAASGECLKNAAYMREMCARSCNACTEQAAAVTGGEGGVGDSSTATAYGLAEMQVRAGLYVDGLRFRCAPSAGVDGDADGARMPNKLASASLPTWDGLDEDVADEEEEEEEEEGAAAGALSPWFGGDGGRKCILDCGAKVEGDWRQGGLIEGLVVSAGEGKAGGTHVDRIELAKCTKDVTI